MEDNIKISLKDNQSHKKAYILKNNTELASEYFEYEDAEKDNKKLDANRFIDSEYWCAMEGVRNINTLLKDKKILAIPNREFYNENSSIFDRINDQLYTYNWVGVVSNSLKDGRTCRIEITSRFDSGDKQYFLLYLLCNVLGINVFDLSIGSDKESDYTVILILLFLRRLLDAYGEGLYKEYVRNEYNDFNFRGALNLNRHMLINNPFVGKTAYSVREHSYDNDILCLIRQTLDYINDYYPELIDGYTGYTSEFKEFMDVIETATPSYRINVNYSERVRCHREITNPLYQNYEEARKLALMILRESGQNIFEDTEEESDSLLIDISWLWEEFIGARLLNDKGYKHLLNNSDDKNRECLRWSEENGKWYPDYIEDKSDTERRCIIDAKYKFWKWNKNEDVHQLLSYLFLTGGQTCGVIYPKIPKDNKDEEQFFFESITLKPYHLFYEKDAKVKMYRLPMIVPQSENMDSFEKYCDEIEKSVKNWKELFDKEFNNQDIIA